MKIADLRLTFDIKPTVVDLVESVTERTGKPVEFRIDKSLQAPATVKIARYRMPHHLMKVRPDQSKVMGYLIANKTANILRMWKLHTEDRKVVASNDSTMKSAATAIKDSLVASAEQLPQHILTMLISGVVNQLSNLPVQVRIERWVAANLPELEAEQRTYLQKDVAETVAGVSNEIERLTPPIVFTTSSAMTYAYVRAVGELLGTNLTQRYNSYQPIVRKGKELYEMVGADDDSSHSSDVALIDRWAGSLGVTEWFIWQDFETMPESYYDDVMP